ncbi:MAG: exo-alpha-sialidase, partial [Armatimonadetes bacterium]|nr:exo-alpha-sialidase [Armatimonadota bacterium]
MIRDKLQMGEARGLSFPPFLCYTLTRSSDVILKTQVRIMRMTMSLALMSIVCVVGVVLCLGSMGAARAQQEGDNWMELQMNNEQWQFVEGAWAEDEQGIITAPQNLGESLAVYTGQAYADFEAEFEFRWDVTRTNAGLVFRAQDAQHYYMVHCPVMGQQYRAEHFWGAISKVDESGYVEVLNMEMVHGVSSAPKVWHKVRVAVEGNEIHAWVDGRPLSVVTDDTYPEPGYVGLSTYAVGAPARNALSMATSFRNLRIRGQEAQASPWASSVRQRKNWFLVNDMSGEVSAGCSNIARAPNGDLVTIMSRGLGVVRSTDNGQTWSASESARIPAGAYTTQLYTVDDQLHLLTLHDAPEPPSYPVPVLLRATSQDNGKTWSRPQVVQENISPPDWDLTVVFLSRLLETSKGTLLLFAYGREPGSESQIIGGRRWQTQGSRSANFCLRSTDGGASWSESVNLDGPPYEDRVWMIPKGSGSETSAAETRDGKIITLTRPYSSPMMWESWSEDGGQTWTQTARGPFPMYACNNSMISTSSGALIIGGRFPAMAVQVSYDDGMTWKCYRIDSSAGWANGAMY